MTIKSSVMQQVDLCCESVPSTISYQCVNNFFTLNIALYLHTLPVSSSFEPFPSSCFFIPLFLIPLLLSCRVKVWKQKGEEYRVTGYGGWSWISKTYVQHFLPRLPGNTNANYRKELEGLGQEIMGPKMLFFVLVIWYKVSDSESPSVSPSVIATVSSCMNVVSLVMCPWTSLL